MPLPEDAPQSYSQDSYEESLNRTAGSAFPQHLIVSEEELLAGASAPSTLESGNLGHEAEPEKEELNETDKLDRETAWHHLANPTKPLTPRHWELCRLLASGVPHWEIQEKMGYTRTWISLLSSHPKIRKEVERMQGVVFERTIEDRFKQMNHRAMDVIEEVITSEDSDAKEKLKAATWLLEKTTGKAKQEIETKGGSLTDFMTLLRQVTAERSALQAGQAETRGTEVLDVTPQPQPKTQSTGSPVKNWVDQNL